MAVRTLNVFGDSFSLGTGSTSPTTLGYVPLLCGAEQFTASNNAVSGSEAPDQAAAIFSASLGARSTSTYLIGMNDQRHFGATVGNIAAFKKCVMAQSLWLSVATTDIIGASWGGISYTGTWSGGGAFGAHYTDTLNDHADFSLTGSVLYIIMIQQDGTAGQCQISIDGNDFGTYNTAPSASITTALGLVYAPTVFRFNVGGSISTSHGIRITKTSATASGSRIYLVAMWGNGMRSLATYPTLYLAGPTLCTTAGYAATGIGSPASTIAYNDAVKDVQRTLAGDGLDVRFVDICSALDPAIQTDSGGCHPNDDGYRQIANKFSTAMA